MNQLQKIDKRIALGITGASGSRFAERFLEVASKIFSRVYVVATPAGKSVVQHELSAKKAGFSLARLLSGEDAKSVDPSIRLFDNENLFAPIASGSSVADAMVVLPCSMGTVSRIRTANSANLLERTADVALKQKKQLIVCPRETPLHAIHLENLYKLALMGVDVLPVMPGYYQHPKSLEDLDDFMVGRVLELLGVDHSLYPAWNSRMR